MIDEDICLHNRTIFISKESKSYSYQKLNMSTVGSLTEGLVGGISTFMIPFVTGIIILFSASSGLVIIGRKNAYRYAKFLSIGGFGYIIIILFALVHNEVHPQLIPISTPAEECAVNPKSYNVTHASDCSKFTPGSLAQDCALHPEKFYVTLKQCSKFITT
jgi:hypothetical protein